MVNSKSKRKRKIPNRAPARTEEIAPQPAPRSDRHQLIALALSSLVCGLLMIINLDRVTHASADLSIGESRHGWPTVYLTRTLKEIPDVYLPRRIYNWPYPPVRNEQQSFSGTNCAIDLAVVLGLTLASYFLISGVVFRYDRWRHPT